MEKCQSRLMQNERRRESPVALPVGEISFIVKRSILLPGRQRRGKVDLQKFTPTSGRKRGGRVDL